MIFPSTEGAVPFPHHCSTDLHYPSLFVNFLGEEGDSRVRAAYGPEKYQRLSELKKKYDPENFFRLNQNIKPAP